MYRWCRNSRRERRKKGRKRRNEGRKRTNILEMVGKFTNGAETEEGSGGKREGKDETKERKRRNRLEMVGKEEEVEQRK